MDNIRHISTTEENQWEEIKPNNSTKGDTLEFTAKKHQKIDGFGGCFNELGWIALNKLGEDLKEEIVKELFHPEKCNFNFCRLPIGANDYAAKWYSLNEKEGDYGMEHFSIERDRSYLIPYIKEAKKYQKNLKLFASPWSPPTWMKFPQSNNYGTLIFEDKVLNAYALYFSKFVEAYSEEEIKIDQIHVQNEPMSSQKFPSCKWTGEELREFIRDYLGPKFEKEDIDVEIWLGTLNGPEVDDRFLTTRFNDYANIVLSDQKARKYISGVGYQWRGKYAIQRTKMAWPEIKLMQTENECGDGNNTWEYARYIFDLIWHYLVNGVSSYLYWNMVLEPGGESTWGWNQNSMITVGPETQEVIFNPEFYLMKHFSSFVKRGAVRIGLKGSWNANSLAFQNPDGGRIIVIHNPFKKLKKINLKTNSENISVDLKPLSFNTIEF